MVKKKQNIELFLVFEASFSLITLRTDVINKTSLWLFAWQMTSVQSLSINKPIRKSGHFFWTLERSRWNTYVCFAYRRLIWCSTWKQLSVAYQRLTLSFASESGGMLLILFIVSISSLKSGWIWMKKIQIHSFTDALIQYMVQWLFYLYFFTSSIALISSLSLSITVMKS